jgi:hypothetical protein
MLSTLKWQSVEVLIDIADIIAREHYKRWSSTLALHDRAVFQIIEGRWQMAITPRQS